MKRLLLISMLFLAACIEAPPEFELNPGPDAGNDMANNVVANDMGMPDMTDDVSVVLPPDMPLPEDMQSDIVDRPDMDPEPLQVQVTSKPLSNGSSIMLENIPLFVSLSDERLRQLHRVSLNGVPTQVERHMGKDLDFWVHWPMLDGMQRTQDFQIAEESQSPSADVRGNFLYVWDMNRLMDNTKVVAKKGGAELRGELHFASNLIGKAVRGQAIADSLTIAAEYTVSFWVQVPARTETLRLIEFNPPSVGGADVGSFGLHVNNNVLEPKIANPTQSIETALIANVPHHIVITRTGSDTMVYLNGEFVVTLQTSPLSNPVKLHLGQPNVEIVFDELWITNEVWDSARIQAIYLNQRQVIDNAQDRMVYGSVLP